MTEAPAVREPYKGLRPYEESDQDFFFGRDVERDVLIDKVLTNRLTLLFAATGVGKSSLLRAAVLPRLKDPRHENLDVVVYDDWVSPPLEGLKEKTLEVLKGRGHLADDAPIADLATLELKDFFQLTAVLVRPPLVVVLDQFEEFFRYQRKTGEFELFLRQLSAAVADQEVPIAVVISMREDFALELNAFKPYLPTMLFECFYRLEKLSPESAEAAIVKPVELVGFRYQEELLEALRKDLSERAETGRFASPLAGWVDTVEPPYLQIVCSQLWEIEKDNSERNLRFATYRDHGGAEGLLKSYVQRVLARFSAEEKRLASLAFNFLVTRHGTKMAYTVGELAKTVAVDVEDLAVVLENLRNARILRSLKRKDVLWYELYHDLFSGIIEEWNDAYKTRQRSRRIAFLGGIVVVAGFLLFTAYDITRNLTEKHFRLNLQRGISDTVELYRGDSGSMDLLALQRFETETEFGRANIEPDKMFRAKSLEDADRLSGELIGYLPSEARIRAYWEVGMVEKALNLADKSISEDDVQRSNRVISGLVFLGSLEIVDLLNARLADEGESYLRQLGLGRSEAVAPSIESLKDEDLEALMGAASALGQQGRSEAVAPLIESLKDADRGVLMSAASALGQLGSSEAVAPLIEILKAANSAVRESAASALGELGRSEAVAPLIECLGIATWSTRREALVALGRIGDARSNGAVSAVFRDGSENRTVKLASAIALLALGPDEGLSYLHSAVNSPLSSARRAVASTLSELPVDPSQTFELLEPLLDDPVLSVKIQALKALRNAGFQPGEEKEGKRNTAVPAGRRRGDWRPPGRQDAGAPSASLRDEEPAGCRRSQRGFSALDCRLLFYGTATNARVSSASKGFSTGHRRITPSTAGSGAYPWHPLDRGGR